MTSTTQPEIAIFASGCFWGTEHIFLKHYPPSKDKGVLKTSVGFIGGHKQGKVGYREVCSGRTGHAEAVRIEFDSEKVGYGELVEFFYRTHDPTTLNQQGNDQGTQYRSAIFPTTPSQHSTAEEVTARLNKERFDGKIVTTIEDAMDGKGWIEAEAEHQEYLMKNPWGYQCPTHRLWW